MESKQDVNSGSNSNSTDTVSTSHNNNSNVSVADGSVERRKSLKRSATEAELEAPEEAPAPKYSKVAYQTPLLKVKKLSEHAKLPTKGSEFAAGYDLYAAHEFVIEPFGKALIKTDLSILMPLGVYGRIAPRSGLAWKHHIDIGAGVIDFDYRGNVGVVMFNHAKTEFKVEKHMRVAQLVLERYEHKCVLVEVEGDLEASERGAKGFGSTGMVGDNGASSAFKAGASATDGKVGKEVNNDVVGAAGEALKSKNNNKEEVEGKEMESENTGDATNVKVV